MKPLLRLENLTVVFHTERGTLTAVDGVSFEIEAGKTLCVVGESGCGKSVTALSLLRLLPSPPAEVKAGHAFFEDVDLFHIEPEKLRRIRGNRISMIFQEPMTSLNPVMTVGSQIEETLVLHRPEWSAERRALRCEELLTKVGIPDPKDRMRSFPHELSGGMRQRIMIAMALACEPVLLIADEPTTALDVTIQAQILDLLRSLQREMGMALLLITHDLGIVAEMADRILVMYAGKVAELASPKDLFSSPLHPYTRGLLDSLPGVQGESVGERLKSIRGSIPDLTRPVSGCRFEPRCDFAVALCKEKEPPLETVLPGRQTACFEWERVQEK